MVTTNIKTTPSATSAVNAAASSSIQEEPTTSRDAATVPCSIGVPSGLLIPDDINERNIREAAGYYAETLGMAVHPLFPSDEGASNERGKKPLLKGFRKHTSADVTTAFLDEYWKAGSTKNLGCVVQPSQVIIDLDSKADDGESVMEWLAAQPELLSVPRERTGGGAHLLFQCKDVPDSILKLNRALVSKINSTVNAELYFAGLNVVLSPSVHPSGHRYRWEVAGLIPEVRWDDLERVFGFVAPASTNRGRPRKALPWHCKHEGDLNTLDLQKVMKELDLLGKCLDEPTKKWAILCPWRDEHSSGGANSLPGSDTVIFNNPGHLPGFKCLHAHCADRSLEQLLDHIEAKNPGLISKNCKKMRAWTPGYLAEDGRPQVALPGAGKPISDFARLLGVELGRSRRLFRHGRRVVEVVTNLSGAPGSRLAQIEPKLLVTIAETCVQVGKTIKDESGAEIFIAESMSEAKARVVLASHSFDDPLPEIRRLLNIPIPMLNDDRDIVYPARGYDDRFLTWLDEDAPAIKPMELADAKAILNDLLAGPEAGGFWWKDEEAKTLALARLLTPFCRGLMNFKRDPVWIFIGNREGVGKDTCAAIAQVLYTGIAETSPAPGKENDEEMRKRISTALLHGAAFLHLANLKNEINYPSLEAATDGSGFWVDRLLGSNQEIRVANELAISISANNGSWSPDLGRRSRVIELHCGIEDLGSHKFRHTDILAVVRENRSAILSALAAFVDYWEEQGRPEGPTGFASFPEWGRVVGGILVCCGYPDPCCSQTLSVAVGDAATQAMLALFQLCHDHFGDRPVKKPEFQKFVREDQAVHELFAGVDFTSPGALVAFAKRLLSFNGRTLGGVAFRFEMTSKNHGVYHFEARGYEKSRLAPSCASGDGIDSGDQSVFGGGGGGGGEKGVSKASSVGSSTNPVAASTSGILSDATPTFTRKSPTSLTSPVRIKDCKNSADLDNLTADLLAEPLIAVAITYKAAPGKKSETKPQPDRFILTAKSTTWRVDLGALSGNGALSATLNYILANKTVYAFEMLPIMIWLRHTCRFTPSKIRCIHTAVRILENGTGNKTDDLDAILSRYLPVAGGSSSPGSGNLLVLKEADHLARKNPTKTECLHQLFAKIQIAILKNHLQSSLDLEHAVLPVIAAMTERGIHVDSTRLKDLAEAGEVQAKGLLLHVDPKSNRIHSDFDPLGTVTGRLTSKAPNLQGIKQGAMRDCFTAPPGHSLVIADYSNIDLRVTAVVADCLPMLATFKRGEDLHRKNAGTFFDKQQDDVTGHERRIAKAFNLGIINGQQPYGMVESARNRYGLSVSLEEATGFRDMFLDEYPEIKERAEQCYRDSRDGVREARTRLGRRRLMPAGTDTDSACATLISTPVQGGVADGMKKAMVLIHNRLPKTAFLVSMIHDEVLVECPDEIAADVKTIVVKAMIEGMNSIFPEVVIAVDANARKAWGAAEATRIDTAEHS